MGMRQERLADEVRDLLANLFLGDQIQDPRLQGITITFVKVSADLQSAKVYFRVFEENAEQSVLEGFAHCKGFIRSYLAGKLTLRRVPDLKFFYDESIEKGARIEEVLRNLKES